MGSNATSRIATKFAYKNIMTCEFAYKNIMTCDFDRDVRTLAVGGLPKKNSYF